MNQLDLLSYELTPEERAEPAAPPPAPANIHLVRWHEARAAVYLRLMGQLMAARHIPPEVRSYEITRLHELRQAALENCK